MTITNLWTPNEAMAVEKLNAMSELWTFVHDFTFQNGIVYEDQPIIVPFPCTLHQIHAKFRVAPTGADAILNLALNGVAVWSGADRPTLAIGETVLGKVDCALALDEGDYLELMDVQKGSAVAGGYGVIRFYGRG